MCQHAPKDEDDLPTWLGDHIDDPTLLGIVAKGGWRYAAAFYRGLFLKACKRENEQKQKNAQLEAEIRHLKHQLFGKKSESQNSTERATTAKAEDEGAGSGSQSDPPKRKRGAQRGHQGHPRKKRPRLPVVEQKLELSEQEKRCGRCGNPYGAFPPRSSSRIEYKISIYEVHFECERRVKTCGCSQSPGIVEAAVPPTLIPKSHYGTSVWLEVLLAKYYLQHPTNHFARDWKLRQAEISTGVLTGGLQRLQPLFEPVYELIVEHTQIAGFWHADETGWPVFGEPRKEHGRERWQLWVFRAKDAVVYVIRPSRATEVPLDHFPEDVVGVLVVDRYSAYKKLANDYEGIILVFCWAHVRRDFLNAAKKYSDLEDWAFAWIEEIRKLYELCETRTKKLEECAGECPELCLEAKVEIVANQEQNALEKQVRQMKERWSNELEELEKEAPPEESKPRASIKIKEKRQRQRELAHQGEKAKVLRSLRRHWCGLTLFLHYPDIPLDNNAGERALRGAAVGRKTYYGSGAQWSIRLTENLFSLFATLEQCGINVRIWLSHYLEFCAKKRGKIPSKEEVKEWLPWNMNEEQREKMSQSLAMRPPPAPAPARAEAQARAG